MKVDKVHQYFERFAQESAGGGVLRCSVLGAMSVVLCEPETAAVALNKGTFQPKPASIYNAFLMFGMKEHNIGTLSEEQEHARVRGHMMRFFNADNVSRIIGQLAQEVRTTLTAIAAADAEEPGAPAAELRAPPVGPAGGGHDQPNLPSGAPEAGIYSDGGEGALVNAAVMAKGNVMRVVFRVFLETETFAPFEAVYDTMEQVTKVSAHPLLYRLLKRGLLPGSRRYRRNWSLQHKYHCELAREAYARPMPEDSTAFWATVRRAFPDAMTDDREFESAASNLGIYMAAYETTANAIAHTLAALAIDQDSQTALAEELQELGLLATPGAPEPREIERADLARMTVLDAVCHESLRLMPPSPIGGLRELARDTKIGGYVVPKGTRIIVPPCTLHGSTAAWGPDAAKWRPDRWLEGSTVAAAKLTAAGVPRFLPFFEGPNNCIGQHLALVELKLVVASLISRLRITMDPQRMAHIRVVEDYVANTTVSVVLQSGGPCWLRMRRRAAAPA